LKTDNAQLAQTVKQALKGNKYFAVFADATDAVKFEAAMGAHFNDELAADPRWGSW